eukprot:13930552-Alexandrium_andersonii.AAC.1
MPSLQPPLGERGSTCASSRSSPPAIAGSRAPPDPLDGATYVDDVAPATPTYLEAPAADALEPRLLEADVEETCPICVDTAAAGEAVAA